MNLKKVPSEIIIYGGMVDVNCLNCNGIYKVKKSRKEKGLTKFCSTICKHDHIRNNKILYKRKPDNCVCKLCKKTFRLKPFSIKRGRGSYCSRTCQADSQKISMTGNNNPNYRHGRTYEKGFYKNTAEIWRSKNRDIISLHRRRQKAIRRSVDGKFSIREIRNLKETQRSKCINCFSSIKDKYHVDHIIPIKLGGTNNIENIQLLCPTCNLSKGAKDPIFWANENGRLL